MKHISLAFTVLLGLSACTNPVESSRTKESPDSRNTIARFELTSMPSYDELLATKQVFTKKLPWTDTYWPYTQSGMARRWGKISDQPSLAGLSSFWQDQINVTREKTVNPLLSPGEKYDLMYRLRWGKTSNEVAIQQQIDQLSELEKTLDAQTDVAGRRAVMAKLYTLFNKSTDLKAWSPMAAEGWNVFLNYNKNPSYKYRNEADTGDDWGWMGYCHGWAPAALMVDAPKHAVLVKLEDKEVLFSEGDIRGLMTKAWADHGPDDAQYFLGRRCNENTADAHGEIPVAGDNRGATGTYTDASGTLKTFTMMDEYMPGAAASGRRIYQIVVDQEPSAGFLIEKVVSGKLYYYLSQDVEEMKAFVETGSTAGLTPAGGVKFYGCWDVNPASFHTILTEYLGKKGLGFVMDRTRTGQVWNQPVYGARFKVGPLLEAAATEDALFRYRAAGTVYLSVVTAEVQWSSEPASPSLDYDATYDQKHISSSKYVYTLEFDADKKLIGGEWGDLAASEKKLTIPDFLYAFKDGSEPKDLLTKGFDYTGLLKPIHACSLATTGVKVMKVAGKNIEYTDCAISKGR